MARSTPQRAAAHPQRVALGAAVRHAIRTSKYGTQEAFADALGRDQTTVSKWERGVTAMTVDQIRTVEDLCELPRGQVLAWAGLIDANNVTWTLNFDELLDAAVADQGNVIDLLGRLEDDVALAAEDQGLRSDRPAPAAPRRRRSATRPHPAPEADGV